MKKIRWTKEAHQSLSYACLVYLPKGYDENAGKKWPLVVYLHGAGERGDNLDVVACNGLAQRIRDGEEFPFVLVAPQCPDNTQWVVHVDALNLFLDDMLQKLNVDENRVYLTGLSMGGMGTWFWAMESPERFAAIVPVCGMAPAWNAASLKNVPVWAFHGEVDGVIPVRESIDMVEAINAAGGSAKLTVYEGVNHDSWVQAYGEKELYTWLLSHSLPETGK